MADVHLWVTLHHTGPGEHLVMGSVVPAAGADSIEPIVRTRVLPDREAALDAVGELALELGAEARARGDRVVDVELA